MACDSFRPLPHGRHLPSLCAPAPTRPHIPTLALRTGHSVRQDPALVPQPSSSALSLGLCLPAPSGPVPPTPLTCRLCPPLSSSLTVFGTPTGNDTERTAPHQPMRLLLRRDAALARPISAQRRSGGRCAGSRQGGCAPSSVERPRGSSAPSPPPRFVYIEISREPPPRRAFTFRAAGRDDVARGGAAAGGAGWARRGAVRERLGQGSARTPGREMSPGRETVQGEEP